MLDMQACQHDHKQRCDKNARDAVVPASGLAAANKQIRELQRLLGKKTMKAEILKEAVEFGRAKKWIAHAPLLPGDD